MHVRLNRKDIQKLAFYSCFFSFLWLVAVPVLIANSTEYVSENGYNDSNFLTNGEKYCLSKYLNKNNCVVFDVGANVGDWTFMALTYAPNAKVYAFEPDLKIFNLLRSKSDSLNIESFPFGLSDQEGMATFWVWGEDTSVEKSGLNGLFYRPILEEMLNQRPNKIQVSMETLDSFCKKNHIEHIDYLKIDTEGNEYFVLLGANRMISNHQIDIIQFEYGGTYIDSKTRLESVYEFLRKNEFDVFRILPKGLLPIVNWNCELENFQYSNYLAILNEKVMPCIQD